MKFPIRRLDDTNLIGSDCNNYKNVYAVHFVEVLTKGSPILRVCRILCKRTVHRRRKLAYP